MKYASIVIAAFVPLLTTAYAGDPTCGKPAATRECSSSCDNCCPTVACKPFCHCLRTWFVTAEPPRVDVLEAVALRRVPAPVNSAALQFQIRSAPIPAAPAQTAGEPACHNAVAGQNAAGAAAETDCQATAEVQQLRARIDKIDGQLERLTIALESMAKKEHDKKKSGE